MTIYEYSIASDFKNADDVDLSKLQTIINSNITINAVVSSSELIGDTVKLILTTTLIPNEETELDTVISNYIFTDIISAEIYDSIVDVNGNGDYLLPSAAFADGHVSLFLRNGIYFETTDVVMPDYGTMVGESGGNVVIHFLGQANGVIADGSGGAKESAGTISIVHLTSTVVGTGTTFTNLVPDDFIRVGTNYYKIASITDNTHLELVDVYQGVTLSGCLYTAQHMYAGVTLNRLIITGSTTSGLYLRACWHFTLIAVSFKQNSPNVNLLDCGDSALNLVLIEQPPLKIYLVLFAYSLEMIRL